MVKMKKFGELNNLKGREEHFDSPDEELKFILWKAELSKELLSFWKSISK